MISEKEKKEKRKTYLKSYYQQKKSEKLVLKKSGKTPLIWELIGCLITYGLSLCVSITAFQQFSSSLNNFQLFIFFASIEALIFFLSFNLSKQSLTVKCLRIITIIILMIGMTFIISKGAYDRSIHAKKRVENVEKSLNELNKQIKQLNIVIEGFQQREMLSKTVELIKKKDELIKETNKIQSIPINDSLPENEIVMIIMRFFISILNISVINRIGQVLSLIFKPA